VEIVMSHNGIRLVAVILASMLALAIGTDAQARRRGVHFYGGHAGRAGGAVEPRQVAGSAAAPGARHFAHGQPPRNNPRGGYGYGFGWYGPVFWPNAYDDVLEDILWGYGLGSAFWDYGYDDIYAGLFSPFIYSDVAGNLLTEQAQAAVPSGRRTDATSRPNQLAQMCGDDSKEVAGWPTARIEQGTSPTAAQRAVVDELADATIRAAQAIKDACPTEIVFTAAGRLEAMQTRIEGMTKAVSMIRMPLDRFYGALTDEQKARLNAFNEQREHDRGSTAGCNAAGSVPRWPADQIERVVQPDPEQKAKLGGLKMAAAAAAEDLRDACPSSLPTTPSARLKAISRRLDVMLKVVKNVRASLGDFYASLSDEQKAQFDTIARQRNARE
jgi:hypothetical protein